MAKETKKTQIIELDKFNINQLPELQNKKNEVDKKLKEFKYVEITDNATYEEAKKSRTGVRTIRTELQKEQKTVEKKIKDFILSPVKEAYNGLIETVTPIEDKQQTEVSRWEDIKEKQRQEKLRIEEARKQTHRDNIDLFFNHNKKIIDELTFEKIPHELVYKINDQEFTQESFEEFDDVFESKVEVLNFQLAEKTNSLQEKENIRLENERLASERKENERKENIKKSIDIFYNKWHSNISEMKFNEIKETLNLFENENPLDCGEFQEDYAQKRANLVRMLEAKINFLTQAENQRIQQEKLDKEKADLEAQKTKVKESAFELKVNSRIQQLVILGLTFDFESSYVGHNFIIDVLDIKTYEDSKWDKLITQIEEVKSKPIVEITIQEKVILEEIDVVEEEVLTSISGGIDIPNEEEIQEVEFEEKSIKQAILDTISDLCSNFLYYDRKVDESLTIEKLNEAVKLGEITIDEMVAEFKKHLENTFNEPS